MALFGMSLSEIGKPFVAVFNQCADRLVNTGFFIDEKMRKGILEQIDIILGQN